MSGEALWPLVIGQVLNRKGEDFVRRRDTGRSEAAVETTATVVVVSAGGAEPVPGQLLGKNGQLSRQLANYLGN